MEQKTMEKVLNQMSEERLQDNQEVRNVKATLEKQQQSLNENKEQFRSQNQEMGILKTGQEILLQRISEPIKQLDEFSAKIDAHSELLKKPVIQKVVHEHHVPKLLYVTVALFCICLSFGFGWFQTAQRSSQYRNNDTKWRKLMLGARPTLTKIMQEVSSSVDDDPDKTRDSVERVETHNQQVWELHQKMVADSAQMHELEGGGKK